MAAEIVKVYELAKELGMDSFSLLDKLKELDIKVKNHMSEMADTDVAAVREHFSKEKGDKKATKTKATSTKTTVKRTKGAKASASSTLGSKTKRTTTVIRRRAKTASPEPTISDSKEKSTAPSATEDMIITETRVSAPVEAAAASEATEGFVAPAATAPAEGQTVTQQEVTKEISSASAATQEEVKDVESASTEPNEKQQKGSGLKFPSLLGARSEGLKQKTGSILNIVKEERKKPPLPKPIIQKATPAGQKAGVTRANQRDQAGAPGIVNLGKEAIDRLIEEENQFKKKTGPGRGEREKEPVDVNVADYRAKKELVFLPKKKKVPLNKEIRKTEITTPAAHKRVIRMENTISVGELAQRMGIKNAEIIKKLMSMGMMATINQSVDFDTASLIANEYKFEVENIAFKEENIIPVIEDKDEELQPRPPIVTVMGHVDHGKTSLLDAIRSAKVAQGEAGGITQHIGAYTVTLDGKDISFIDTPGHEAFTVMRARGANVTDIVILVVAADDGVMPQTREAVDHARAAGVPIIVAVNKIDKPGANPEKVMKQLAEINLLSEDWGGEHMFVNVSAIQQTGIKELLEAILLQSEMLDLKANPNRPAEGTILEARLDRSRGPVVNVLVKKGTLKVGDPVVAGVFFGKVRAMTDDKGRLLKEVRPGFAAEILGLEGVPTAGDSFNALSTETQARQLAIHRAQSAKAQDSAKSSKMTLEELFSKAQQGEVKELPIILKTDVVGSTEALRDSLTKLSTEKVKVKILSASTGGISESDVLLATASNAIILGFNVRPETKARALAESEKVEIKTYSIIYELLDDVKKAMAGMLEKKAVEKYLGRAEVRSLFSVPKVGTIAGSAVIDGKITRNAQIRVLRDSRVVYTGKLASLKRFKDDAKEVAQGYECGIGIENFNDVKTGDIIEAFQIELVAQELGSAVSASASV